MSNVIDDSGPAFPIMAEPGAANYLDECGVTRLEYFAAKAMQSLLEGYLTNESDLGNVVATAWAVADKMIEAKAAFLTAKAELLASRSAP